MVEDWHTKYLRYCGGVMAIRCRCDVTYLVVLLSGFLAFRLNLIFVPSERRDPDFRSKEKGMELHPVHLLRQGNDH